MPTAQEQRQGYCGSLALAVGGKPEITTEFTATLICVLDLLLLDFTEQTFSTKLGLTCQ